MSETVRVFLKRLAPLLVAVVMALPGVVAAQQDSGRKMMRCATTHYPPFAIYNARDNLFDGSDMVFVSRLAEQFNWHLSVENLPWARLKRLLGDEKFECFFAMADLPERREVLEYTDYPLHITHFALFTRKGDNQPIQTIGILRGIAVPETTKKRFELANTRLFTATSNEQLLEMLLIGRIDGFVTNDKVGEYVIAQAKVTDKVEYAIDPGTVMPTYLAFRKGVVDINAVNQALAELIHRQPEKKLTR